MSVGYKVGVDKKQLSLLPICLDDYIPMDHICRVIVAFTALLDMVELGFKYAEYKNTGCRPYDPRMMLNLYIYGYLHRIRSSRRLEAETLRNVEVMWLMGDLKPDDKTICNFRKDNAKVLKEVFRKFVRMCRELDLYGGEIEATDSTKFRANNSRKNNHNETTVERELNWLDKQIDEYLKALEEGDKAEAGEKVPDAEAIKAALEHLKERKEKIEAFEEGDKAEAGEKVPDAEAIGAALENLKERKEKIEALEEGDKAEAVEKAPDTEAIRAALENLKKRKEKFEALKERVEKEGEVSTVDPDARLMYSGGDARKLDVCYSVPTVVDSKYHLIVDFEVVDRSDDKGYLGHMSELAKEALGVEELTNLADKGFYDGQDIANCEANGVTCLVAKPLPGGTKKEEGFTRNDFIYDREGDCYICPCKNQMRYMRNQNHSDGKEYRIYANYGACTKCPCKSQCTEGNHRQIYRPLYQDTLDVVDERTRENKELYRKRQEIVEHPFGTIKYVWGYKQFLCRGKPKVTGETALAYLAYNMRRFINIFTGIGKNPAMVLG